MEKKITIFAAGFAMCVLGYHLANTAWTRPTESPAMQATQGRADRYPMTYMYSDTTAAKNVLNTNKAEPKADVKTEQSLLSRLNDSVSAKHGAKKLGSGLKAYFSNKRAGSLVSAEYKGLYESASSPIRFVAVVDMAIGSAELLYCGGRAVVNAAWKPVDYIANWWYGTPSKNESVQVVDIRDMQFSK